MKKVLVTILAFTYLAVSSGATIHLHYCMGRLVGWDLGEHNKKQCDNCGMEKKENKGCCRDEHKTLQIEKDQKVTEATFQFIAHTPAVLTVTYADLPPVPVSSMTMGNAATHAPPAAAGVPVFLRNCNFRI